MYRLLSNSYNKYEDGHGLVIGSSLLNMKQKEVNENYHLTIISFIKQNNKDQNKYIKRSKSI